MKRIKIRFKRPEKKYYRPVTVFEGTTIGQAMNLAMIRPPMGNEKTKNI